GAGTERTADRPIPPGAIGDRTAGDDGRRRAASPPWPGPLSQGDGTAGNPVDAAGRRQGASARLGQRLTGGAGVGEWQNAPLVVPVQPLQRSTQPPEPSDADGAAHTARLGAADRERTAVA